MFDLDLDLTPTAGEDPFNVHDALPLTNDEPENAKEYLISVTCEEIMPQSAKVVVLDANISVSSAFEALLENNVSAAVVWDSVGQDYAGVVTFVDFIEAIVRLSRNLPSETVPKKVENIEPLLQMLKNSTAKYLLGNSESHNTALNLIYVEPHDNLLEALKIFLRHNVSAIPVILHPYSKSNSVYSRESVHELGYDTVLYVLTSRRILEFLLKVLPDLCSVLEEPILHSTLLDKEKVAFPDTCLSEVLELLILSPDVQQGVSITSKKDGHLIHLFLMSDLVNLYQNTQKQQNQPQTTHQRPKIVDFIELARFIYVHLGTPLDQLFDLPLMEKHAANSTCTPGTKVSQVAQKLLSTAQYSNVVWKEEDRTMSLVTITTLLSHFVSF